MPIPHRFSFLEMASFTGLLSLALLLLGGALVHCSDVNWGKKVSCFVVDGTTVCPGCNYRAGLSCPRSLKKLPSCNTPPPPPIVEVSTEPTESIEDFNVTEKNPFVFNATIDPDQFLKAPTKSPIDMAIFLYRILGSRMPYNRYKRQTQDLGEVCNWNGDCPCPQICCKTGPDCPKRCVMGIRLPPPWG